MLPCPSSHCDRLPGRLRDWRNAHRERLASCACMRHGTPFPCHAAQVHLRLRTRAGAPPLRGLLPCPSLWAGMGREQGAPAAPTTRWQVPWGGLGVCCRGRDAARWRPHVAQRADRSPASPLQLCERCQQQILDLNACTGSAWYGTAPACSGECFEQDTVVWRATSKSEVPAEHGDKRGKGSEGGGRERGGQQEDSTVELRRLHGASPRAPSVCTHFYRSRQLWCPLLGRMEG